MKKTLALLMALLMVLSLGACGQKATTPAASTEPAAAPEAAPAEAPAEEAKESVEPITVRFAHGIPEGEKSLWIVENWMQQVEEKSDGRIKFDYYPGSQLGSQEEMIEQLDNGAIDIMVQEPTIFQSRVPELGIFYSGYIAKDYDHYGRILYGDAGKLVKEAFKAQTNCELLGYCFNGAHIIVSKKPVNSLAEAKGLIVRAPNAQSYLDCFELLGMAPTPMSFSEMYTALQTGVVEAVQCPAQSLYAGGYHLLAPYTIVTRHIYACMVLVTNSDFYAKLPADIQKLMVDVWESLQDEMNKIMVDSEQEVLDAMVADGSTICYIEDVEDAIPAFKDYWYSQAEKLGGTSKDVLDAILACRDA